MFGLKVSDMTDRFLLLLVFLTFLFSCSSPLEKSVLTPLTSKELDKVAGEDISFLATYSIVEEKSNYISTPADSARWREITYKRLHSYLNTINSAQLNSPLFTQLREKWERIYNSNNFKVDSIITYWNTYLKENSPDSLVSITFSGIEIERIRNRNKEIDTLVKAKIKILPLRERIDSMFVLYSFAPSNESPVFYFPFNGALNCIKQKKRISGSSEIKVYPYLLPNIKRALINEDSSIVFRYDIVSLYSNGKCYNADTLENDLPKSVLQYNLAKMKEEENLMFDELYYREKIIKDLINPSFISQSAYIKVNAEDYYKEIDSLVFSYTNLNGEM